MNIIGKLKTISARYDELRSLMSETGVTGEEFVKMSKELASIEPIVETYNIY